MWRGKEAGRGSRSWHAVMAQPAKLATFRTPIVDLPFSGGATLGAPGRTAPGARARHAALQEPGWLALSSARA